MKKPKPIKPFKTLEEEAKFWDTHDTSELFKRPKAQLNSLKRTKTVKFAF